MCSIDSANAPEFFLHHGFIDKIWWDWQKKTPANKNAYFPSINMRLQASNYYPRDFLDIAKQPGCVKACYDEPGAHNAKAVHKFLEGRQSVFIFHPTSILSFCFFNSDSNAKAVWNERGRAPALSKSHSIFTGTPPSSTSHSLEMKLPLTSEE